MDYTKYKHICQYKTEVVDFYIKCGICLETSKQNPRGCSCELINATKCYCVICEDIKKEIKILEDQLNKELTCFNEITKNNLIISDFYLNSIKNICLNIKTLENYLVNY